MFWRLNKLSFLLIYLIAVYPVSAQWKAEGIVRETFTRTPIPYAHLQVKDKHYFTDEEGGFNILFDSTATILQASHFLHRTVQLTLPASDTIGIVINLNKYDFFFNERKPSPEANALIEKVILNKKKYSLKETHSYAYSTYTRYAISTEHTEKANAILNKIPRWIPLRVARLHKHQHLLLAEALTDQEVLDEFHQKEVLQGLRSSGIEMPSMLVQTHQHQWLSVYDNFIGMAGKDYISPLSENCFKRYHFLVIDTAVVGGDSVFVIKYNPKPGRNFAALKGLLYINTQGYAVQYFQAGPAIEKRTEIRLLQKYIRKDSLWLKAQTLTSMVLFKNAVDSRVRAYVQTHYSDYDFNKVLNAKNYNEVVAEYPEDLDRSHTVLDQKRPFPLTLADSNTYAYAEQEHKVEFLHKLLLIGENIYFGWFPVGRVSVDLDKILSNNRIEGRRLGLGLMTNQKFSKIFALGGYAGYGLRDQRMKYGFNASWVVHKPTQLKLSSAFAHDLREAGYSEFAFYKPQYSSENLRRYNLTILDRVVAWENALSLHPFKYADMKFTWEKSRVTPTYAYTYQEVAYPYYDFSEVKAAIRYAFREKHILLPIQTVRQKSAYPILYFQYTKSVRPDWDYEKIEFRLEQSIRVLGWGTTSYQMNLGQITGSAPYTKLYNGRGSYRQGSIVIHNSFETMAYNEFLGDRYFNLFISHDFGRLLYRVKLSRPRLFLIHNAGVAYLKDPSKHLGIGFKTMERGYFELGSFVANVFYANIYGLKTGFGAGLFLRYGPYAHPRVKENIVFKFALNFGL